MAAFGAASEKQLATCDDRLQRLLREAIKYLDFTVVEGHRNEEDQEKAYAKGASKLHWPKGNHNARPSRAADIAPFPIDWSEKTTALARFAFLSGVVHACAQQLGIRVRFGWDWNRNLDPRDETFLDWPHIELDEP